MPTQLELAYLPGLGGGRRKCDISESSVYFLLTSRSPRLSPCKSRKENSAAFPVHLGREFVFFLPGQTEVMVSRGA